MVESVHYWLVTVSNVGSPQNAHTPCEFNDKKKTKPTYGSLAVNRLEFTLLFMTWKVSSSDYSIDYFTRS